MTKQVTVQAVAAAIRVTAGVSRSHKYASPSRRIRSVGVYTIKDYAGRIVLDYNTNGYQHAYAVAEAELELVTATLETKGYRVVKVMEKTWSLGEPQVKRIVEVA